MHILSVVFLHLCVSFFLSFNLVAVMKSDSGCATMFQMTAALVFFLSLLFARCSDLCAVVGDCLANRFCVLLSGDSDGFCTHFGLWILVELQNITNLYLSGEQY